MLQKTLKTTKGALQINIPNELHEVTLGQLIKLQSATELSDLQAIQILSGVPISELKNVKNFSELQIFNDHVNSLSLQIKNLYNSNSLPKKVTFNMAGKLKTVSVITNLSIQPAGAFFAARDVITDEIKEHVNLYGEEDWKENFNPSLESCALILAHYFYCPVTAKLYDEYEAELFAEQVKQLPFTDALPIAKNFFLSYPNLLKPRIGFWPRLQLLWKKRLGLNRFRSLDMLIP